MFWAYKYNTMIAKTSIFLERQKKHSSDSFSVDAVFLTTSTTTLSIPDHVQEIPITAIRFLFHFILISMDKFLTK